MLKEKSVSFLGLSDREGEESETTTVFVDS